MTSKSLGFFMIRFTIAFLKVKTFLPKINMAENALSWMLYIYIYICHQQLLYINMHPTKK